jgi:hypothetical protein
LAGLSKLVPHGGLTISPESQCESSVVGVSDSSV